MSESEFGRSIEREKLFNIGTDVMIGERHVGGPGSGRDIRMFVSRESLEAMLLVAKASGTRRVVLQQCGIRVTTWRRKDGSVYEAWGFFSAVPAPEKGTPYERLLSEKTRRVKG